MYWSQILTDSSVYTYEYFAQEDVCRLCWSQNASTELFQENFQEKMFELSLVEIIKDCLDLELRSINPNKLCDSCCNEIQRFYSYKKFCREANEKLQEILLRGLSEIKNKELELSTIKAEVKDEDFDKIDVFLDDSIDFEDANSDKKIKTSTKFKKKYVHKRTPTYCNICCVDLNSKEELTSHNIEFHGIENEGTLFKCLGCEKRFKSRRTRISHEIKFCKGLKDGYKCSICDRYLPKRCMYEYHMRDHRHNIVMELPEHIFKCKKCLKLFKTNELLKKHLLEHVKEKNFVCDTCGRIFTRQDYLHKHILTHTGTKRHKCPHCDFRATQRSSLTVHIRTHTGERPYTCDICPQRCISSSNLRAHKKRHLGVKKYECTICSKKFGYKISLEEHISSAHVRSESHSCEHCGATYTRVRGLRRHLAAKHGKQVKSKTVEQNIIIQVTEDSGNKIHILKDVEYELKDSENVLLLKHQDGDVYMTCGRIFTRQDYLHKHILTHTGTKRHKCPHCDFRATQRSSLTVHISALYVVRSSVIKSVLKNTFRLRMFVPKVILASIVAPPILE